MIEIIATGIVAYFIWKLQQIETLVRHLELEVQQTRERLNNVLGVD